MSRFDTSFDKFGSLQIFQLVFLSIIIILVLPVLKNIIESDSVSVSVTSIRIISLRILADGSRLIQCDSSYGKPIVVL